MIFKCSQKTARAARNRHSGAFCAWKLNQQLAKIKRASFVFTCAKMRPFFLHWTGRRLRQFGRQHKTRRSFVRSFSAATTQQLKLQPAVVELSIRIFCFQCKPKAKNNIIISYISLCLLTIFSPFTFQLSIFSYSSIKSLYQQQYQLLYQPLSTKHTLLLTFKLLYILNTLLWVWATTISTQNILKSNRNQFNHL